MKNESWKNYFSRVESFLPGNSQQLKLATAALISGKHCLIEDIPGKGKTLLAKYLGKNFNLNFKRIQCTNDLMPSDIVGFHQWNMEKPTLRSGPIFTDVLLVDEINRASPRTQSSLLQAMEEKNVTLDDQTYELSKHFCVLATQNPQEHVGTTPLPESQIDRFLFKFPMGVLSYEQELSLLQSGARHEKIKEMTAEFSLEALVSFKQNAEKVQIPQTVFEWTTLCLQKSREDNQVSALSSRAGLDFISGLKSWAIVHDRNQVIIDDFVALFPYCFSHRLFIGKKESHSYLLQKCHEWLKQLKL
jgi:MoxR-like ATPase